MAQIIRMPSLSPTMEQGILSKWHIEEGTNIAAGDLLAEIETDKTTMEFEAVDPGVIGKILVPDGSEEVKVNQPIAILLEDGESMPDNIEGIDGLDTPFAPKVGTPQPATDQQQKDSATKQIKIKQPSSKPVRIFASPLARRIANEKNVDLKTISGSGPHGRIIKFDVENTSVVTPQTIIKPLATTDVAVQYQDREYTAVPLDRMRKTVASRLSQSKSTVPHFYLRREFVIDDLLKLRVSSNKALQAENIRLSINDFVIRAAALALQNTPEANAVWAGDQILQFKPCDIAVAVAIEGGLLTPVIRDAETKSVKQLSVEMKSLAAKAKSRKLMPADYNGGTFSISNLGMFGISNFDAVINPPHASILAVGAAQRRAVEAEDGSVAFATMMPITLSCDHRVIDGAVGAKFLAAIAEKIENPLSMLL